MANDYRNVIISFLILGLFLVLISTIIVQVGARYGVEKMKIDEATQGSLDLTDYEVELEDVDSDASAFREAFESGEVDDVDDPSGIFSVAGDIIGVITTPFNILAKVMSNIFHIPLVFTRVLLAILNVVLLAGIWALIRRGD
jgi:uncharacterized membrane protein